MNEHQQLTRNIRKPGDVSNLKFCAFIQNCNGLINWSFESRPTHIATVSANYNY